MIWTFKSLVLLVLVLVVAETVFLFWLWSRVRNLESENSRLRALWSRYESETANLTKQLYDKEAQIRKLTLALVQKEKDIYENVLFQESRMQVRAKHNMTMMDMKAFGTALEAYAVDYNLYPSGKLKQTLEPTYIRRLPENDSWSRPFIYKTRNENKEYSIFSSGQDGVPQSADDYEFSNGSFTKFPDLKNLKIEPLDLPSKKQ